MGSVWPPHTHTPSLMTLTAFLSCNLELVKAWPSQFLTLQVQQKTLRSEEKPVL